MEVYFIIGGLALLGGGLVWVVATSRKSGKARERVGHLEENEDARKRMEGVKPAGESDTIDKLRDGKF